MNLPGLFLHVPGLLTKEELEQIDTLIPTIRFVDGKSTATGAARDVKNNLQASNEQDEVRETINTLILGAVSQSPFIQQAVMPKFVLPPIISKYEPGMSYGWHTDYPLMGEFPTIRVDVSMTLFLNDPASYEGGELLIHTHAGTMPYKVPKGDAIIYPTTRLHGVSPVVRGVRTAAVTWMQCVVREADKRELLLQLKTVQEMVGAKQQGSMEHLLLMQVHSNLLRMWAEM